MIKWQNGNLNIKGRIIEAEDVDQKTSDSKMSWHWAKLTNRHLCWVKPQISLGICTVWSVLSVCRMQCFMPRAKTDQTSPVYGLIQVFAGHTWFCSFFCALTQAKSRLRIKISTFSFHQGMRRWDGPGRAKMCLMPYVKNKGADQPAHPRSLISTFVVCSLDSMVSLVSRSKISRF